MAGSYDLADAVDLTADSEYDPRTRATTTLQIHHTAYPSDAGSRDLMDPGGRTVSANYLLLQDGTLVEVVPLNQRAYTSASSFDHESVTVEVVNQTGGPEWGISEKQRLRLAKLAQGLFALKLIKSLARGIGGILGHYEVPGTYATACPGPDMYLDHISELAQAGPIGNPIQEDEEMTYVLVNQFPNEGALPGVPKDATFVGSGTDPLVWVSNWGPEQINGVTPAQWTAQAIAERIGQVGLRGSGANLDKVYKSMADARGNAAPVYTLGAAKVTIPPIEIPPIEVGDVTVAFDYDAAAKANAVEHFDELARRVES